jgi:competence protein ComEC
MGLYTAALGAGFSMGAAAWVAGSREPRFGLPQGEIIGFSGVLKEDPRAFSDGRGMGRLVLEQTAGRFGLRSSARGEALVFFPSGTIPRLREFGRGSTVYVEGSFVPPQASSPEPRFRAESVHIITAAPPLERFRTGIRMGLLELFAGSPGSWGGLALALLLGVRDTIDAGVAENYQRAGCSHVLALSGMHLAILSSMIAFFLKKPLGLKPAALAGALFILAYVFLVGPQPSLYRSAIMYLLGTLMVLGILPGRMLLGLAFLIQLAIQPESAESPSFVLSYLALFGILYLGEPVHELLRGRLPEILLKPLTASLGAFIATQTVTVLFFGVLRPVGIGAGLIVVPLITLFMTFSMGWLVLALLFPPMAGPVGIILSIIYNALDRLVVLAAKAPGIAGPDPGVVFAVSLGLGAVLVYLRKRQSALRKTLVFD